MIHETQLSSLEITAADDLTDGIYRVWLRPFNAADVVSDWSETFDFPVT
ncbi:MAG: hypothetical protein P8K08_23990 [Fuerstiella sp.]|nr:hypothetical protein [Fuerstiella sp.]